MAAEQVPQVLTEAFKDAKPEVNAAAQQVVSSFHDGQPALLQIHELASRDGLSDEQRKAAYRAAAALHQKTIEDAARGDKKAQEELEVYRASK